MPNAPDNRTDPPEFKGRILVVDDEVALTGFLSELLMSRGYVVKALNDSREALQLFKSASESFDLILTDQTMPGLTGAEMATEMLQIRPALPIILTTGFSELIDADGARALGISAYLHKPVDIQQLLFTIRDLLSTHRPDPSFSPKNIAQPAAIDSKNSLSKRRN